MRSTAAEGAARRRETPFWSRASLERMREERAVESMNATSPISTTTVPTSSAARSMACWNLGAVWRSISPRTNMTEYPSACSTMLTSNSVPVRPFLESMPIGPWILSQVDGPVNYAFRTGMQRFLLIFGRYGRENHRASRRVRRRGQPLPLDQELLQGRPRLRQATLRGRRRQKAPQGHLLHRRETGDRRDAGHAFGALLRLQPQQVRLQGTLQTARGTRDPDPIRGEDRLPQGRLGHRRRRRHDAPRRPRGHLRPRLRRRGLRRGHRVPPERERHPRRGHKRGPVYLPVPSRPLRRTHGSRRYPGSFQEGSRHQASALSPIASQHAWALGDSLVAISARGLRMATSRSGLRLAYYPYFRFEFDAEPLADGFPYQFDKSDGVL